MSQKVYIPEVKNPLLFDMVYQPIISLNTRKLYGYEAFLRPKNDKPETVISRIAKRGGLINLEAAICYTVAREFINMSDNVAVFINLTPESYSYADGIVMMDALSPLNPRKAIIELTEIHSLPEDIRAVSKNWKKKGYRLAIDDVSSGYSRLAAIAELEPDFIKLDKPCVKGVLESDSWRKVFQSIVNMAKSINAKLIGEGIETRAEMDFLTRYGIDYGQGYYIGRPTYLQEAIKDQAVN